MLKLRALLLVFTIFFISSGALASDLEIYSAKSAQEINNSLVDLLAKRNTQKTLLLLPIDAMIETSDPVFRTSDESLQRLAARAFKKAKHSRKSYLDELLLTKYDNRISDSDWVSLVQNVQKIQCPIIITTRNVSGSFNKISHLEVWSWSYLQKLGIDLSKGSFNDKQVIFNKHDTKVRGTYPTFYRGLLSCNSSARENSPHVILSSLLVRYLKWFPDVVYIVDKDEEYIKSLAKQLRVLKKDVQVVGFVYAPESTDADDLDPKLFAKSWDNVVKKLNKVSRAEIKDQEDPYEQ